MIERGVETSWAHFELVSQKGYFQNLLWGIQPSIEVALMDKTTLELNLGLSKQKQSALPAMPEGWKPKGKYLWTVPVQDLDELISWMDRCLAGVSEIKPFTVTGWIEGL